MEKIRRTTLDSKYCSELLPVSLFSFHSYVLTRICLEIVSPIHCPFVLVYTHTHVTTFIACRRLHSFTYKRNAENENDIEWSGIHTRHDRDTHTQVFHQLIRIYKRSDNNKCCCFYFIQSAIYRIPSYVYVNVLMFIVHVSEPVCMHDTRANQHLYMH